MRSSKVLQLSMFLSLSVMTTLAVGQSGMQVDPPLDPIPDKIWVSRIHGVDSNPGTQASPVQSITQALTMAPVQPNHPTIIMVGPGLYTDDQGPETFPLQMKPNVSLQGSGALETAIGSLFSNTIIEFGADREGAFDDVFVDGLHILHFPDLPIVGSGIEINASITRPFPANPTISNCFITDHPGAGVEINSRVSPFQVVVHEPKFIHCTFRFNFVGVVNSEALSQPGFLNCLLVDSLIQDMPQDDLQGIDQFDLEIGGVNSNVFGRANTPPAAAPNGPPPQSLVNVEQLKLNLESLGVAGLFVDDHLKAQPPFSTLGNDFRLNPELFHLGDDPDQILDRGIVPGETWTWDNNTEGSQRLSNRGDAFDWDCEGYGNPRVVPYLDLDGFVLGEEEARARPDIGADEVGHFVMAGHNRGHLLGRTGKVFSAQTDFFNYWTHPEATNALAFFTLDPTITGNPPQFILSDVDFTPNLRAPGTVEPTLVPPFGFAYLSGQPVSFPTGFPAVVAVDPQVSGVMNGFYNHQVLITNQVLFPPTGSGTSSTVSNVNTLTNLQSYLVDN